MDESQAKRANAQRLYDQRAEQIGHLPAQILLDLARNEAANRDWRKAAVQFLLDGKHPQAGHPELAGFVAEIQQEKTASNDVQAVVEAAIEDEFPGAPSASVTTSSLWQDAVIENATPIIRNPNALGDDALVGD